MKKVVSKKAIYTLITITYMCGVHIASAVTYTPIIDSIPSDLGKFVNWAVQLIISLGSAFAVLVIVLSGFNILLNPTNPNAISGAKSKLFNALLGLGLLLISYLILDTINPDLVDFTF